MSTLSICRKVKLPSMSKRNYLLKQIVTYLIRNVVVTHDLLLKHNLTYEDAIIALVDLCSCRQLCCVPEKYPPLWTKLSLLLGGNETLHKLCSIIESYLIKTIDSKQRNPTEDVPCLDQTGMVLQHVQGNFGRLTPVERKKLYTLVYGIKDGSPKHVSLLSILSKA